jgi:hypothetical protein
MRLKVLTHYGGDPPRCICCGERELAFLTLDHPNGHGGAHRRSIYPNTTARRGGAYYYSWLHTHGYPPEIKIEVRCFNCNMAKGQKGICPHQRRKVA